MHCRNYCHLLPAPGDRGLLEPQPGRSSLSHCPVFNLGMGQSDVRVCVCVCPRVLCVSFLVSVYVAP